MLPAHGGPVEYVEAVLLVLQVLIARSLARKWRSRLPGGFFVSVATLLVLVWSLAATGLYLTWSGKLYSSHLIPTVPRTAIVVIGYFWILVSTLAMALAAIARFAVPLLPAYSPNRRNLLRAVGVVAFATPVAAIAFGGIVERNRYRVRELDLPIAGLHPDLDGFSITQVSDLHVSPFLSAQEAGRVIDLANELKGDLAIFTGDLISESGDPLDDAIRELIRLRAPEGALGCMGNHEQYAGCRNYLERQARLAGLVFLRDSATQIRRGGGVLNFAGVDYQRRTKTVTYLAGTQRHVVTGASNILLSHNPDVFPAAIDRGFQAVISGHTHGGQVNVEILHQNINPARFRTPFISGLYQQRGASCFVTNGIGTIGIPVRLGAPPEVALLRLRRA
jgi:uncharacterized protein